MPQITDVFCDIDNFLFVPPSLVAPNANQYNLQRIDDKSYKVINGYYSINSEPMRLILHAWKAKGIRVHFITQADYKTDDMCKDLKRFYRLPEGFFKGSVYINRTHFKKFKEKVDKIKLAKKKKMIPEDAVILAIDDLPHHLRKYKQEGIQTVHACGFPVPWPKLDEPIVRSDLYLQEIISICGLDIELPPYAVVPDEHSKLIATITAYWECAKTLSKFNTHANIAEIYALLQEHRLDLRDLTLPGNNGITLDVLALGGRRHDVQALIHLMLGENLPQKMQYYKSCMQEALGTVRQQLQESHFDEAAIHLQIAIDNAEVLAKNNCVTKQSKMLIRKGPRCFELLYAAAQEYAERKSSVPKQYSQSCIELAVQKYLARSRSSAESLSEYEQTKLVNFMADQFSRHYHKFDRLESTELSFFQETLSDSIVAALKTYPKCLFWSSGMFIEDYDALCVSISHDFACYQRKKWPKPLLLPIPRSRDSVTDARERATTTARLAVA